MTGTLTITAKTGPAQQVTAKLYTGLTRFTVNFETGIVTVFGPNLNNEALEFDITAVTVFTCTVSGANGQFALTLS